MKDSSKFLPLLYFVEIWMYGWLVYDRIKVVQMIQNLADSGILELIDLFSYENGWNFIFLSMTISSIPLSFYIRKSAWLLKTTGLLSLSTTLILESSWMGLATSSLLLLYFTPALIVYFQIPIRQRFYYFLVVLGLSILLFFCSNLMPLIAY